MKTYLQDCIQDLLRNAIQNGFKEHLKSLDNHQMAIDLLDKAYDLRDETLEDVLEEIPQARVELGLEEFQKKQERQWFGPAPTHCDVCQTSVRHSTFIDGRMNIIDQWAVMCEACHKTHGVGLGVGKGQMYIYDNYEGAYYRHEPS